MISGAYKTSAWQNARCDAVKPSIGNQLNVVTMPVVVNKQGQPESGLLQVHQPGTVATVPLLPGTTHADPILEKDAAFYAFTAAAIDPKGCKPIYIADTTFVAVSSEAPVIAGKPGWIEQWTVAQCDKRSEVEMRFTPDRTGTVITSRRKT